MVLYHKWDVKNDFAYVLQFFSLISDSLGSVGTEKGKFVNENAWGYTTQDKLCSLLMTNHSLQQKALEWISEFEFKF